MKWKKDRTKTSYTNFDLSGNVEGLEFSLDDKAENRKGWKIDFPGRSPS
jgi:hypothetical protein